MAAVFRTPLGAALLAVEVLHRDDFESDALVPAVLASVVSYSQIVLLPTGAGTLKRIERDGIEQYGHQVHWMPDGQQIIFSGIMPGQETRCFIQNVNLVHTVIQKLMLTWSAARSTFCDTRMNARILLRS